MGPIDLREGQPAQEFAVTAGQQAALVASEVVRAAASPRTGLVRICDKGLVGAVRIGTGADAVEVRIAPKLRVSRLLFLVGYAQNPKGWRDEEVDAAEQPDLLPAVGHAFARAAERALGQGVLLGYRQVEEAAAEVRGRIREADQLNRRHGLPYPVELSYDEHTADITENRLLLAAARRLLTLPGIAPATARMLKRVDARLPGVSPLDPRGRLPTLRPARLRTSQPTLPSTWLPAWQPTRLNRRYHTALGLAELVLRGGSYELRDGTRLAVDGLLLCMWRVHEDFVTYALRDALRKHGGHCTPQDRTHHLDHGRRVELHPDLVYYRAGEAGAGEPGAGDAGRLVPAVVVDAKYMIEKASGGHREDLYQMLAYCTALRVPRGYLVYPTGHAPPQEHRIHGTQDITIVQRVLDLSLPRTELLAQVDALAADIAHG